MSALKNRNLNIAIAAVALAAFGCASQHVERLEGQGTTRTYAAPYDLAWKAAIDAVQVSGLHIDQSDKTRGYIAAHTEASADTWGEEVGVWLKDRSSQTTVEVVSRRVGPSFLIRKNWEEPILNNITVNLQK